MSNEDDGVAEQCISGATDLLQLQKQVRHRFIPYPQKTVSKLPSGCYALRVRD